MGVASPDIAPLGLCVPAAHATRLRVWHLVSGSHQVYFTQPGPSLSFELSALYGDASGQSGIVIDGDLTLTHAASISDRLMSLVVTGNLAATDFHVYATEVAIFGDFSAKLLTDHDGYLCAQGKTAVDKIATYDD